MSNYKDEIARARYLINSTFGELEFKEDTHQYFLPQPDGSKKEYDCVSNFTKQWDTVDYNQIAENYAKKHGETAEYWRSEWKKLGAEACDMGTQVHEFAESLGWLSNNEGEKICYSARSQYNPLTNQLDPLQGFDKLSLKEKAAKQFWIDMATEEKFKNLHFVMAETKIYTSVGPYAENYNNNYAGTFDLLLYYDDPVNQDNSGFCIFDYKTNKSLENSFAQRNHQMLAAPFNDLVEESKSHYTLQLSCYQVPLEAIGLKVIARRLVHLTDKGTYELVSLPNVTDKIKDALRK